MEEQLQVGVIASTHGLKGEVKVYPTTDDKNRFKKLKTVALDTGKEHITLEIEQVKFVKQMVVLKFREFNDINEIEKYKGKSLFINREQAVPLGQDEYFIADLIGLNVVTEELDQLGAIKDVIQTGANDVYVVETKAGEEILIPAIKDCILNIDLEAQEIKVHMMKGLV